MSCLGTGYLVALFCLIPVALYGLAWAIEVVRGFRLNQALRAQRLLASVQAEIDTWSAGKFSDRHFAAHQTVVRIQEMLKG